MASQYKNWEDFLKQNGYVKLPTLGWVTAETPQFNDADYKRGGPSEDTSEFSPYNPASINLKVKDNHALWERANKDERDSIQLKINDATQNLALAKEIGDKDGVADAQHEKTAWEQVLKGLNSLYNSLYRNTLNNAAKAPGGITSKPVEAPTTGETMRETYTAYRDLLPQIYPLEAEAEKAFTKASGQAIREETLRNLAAAEEPAKVSAARQKIAADESILARIEAEKNPAAKERLAKYLSTAEDQALVADYDQSISELTPYQRQAAIEGTYNLAGKQQEFGMLESQLPRYQQLLQSYLPGQQQIIQGLGQLGMSSTTDAQRGLALEDYLAPFREQVQATGPGGTPVVDAQGNPVMQSTGPLRQLDITSGLQAVAPFQPDLTLGGLAEYAPGSRLQGLQEYTPGAYLQGLQEYAPGSYLQGIPDPELQSNLLSINQNLVNQYMGTMPGVQEGAQQMADIANERLAAGADLSPEELRIATQAARDAYASRGTALGPQAIGSEILARTELARQREMENINLGSKLLGNVSALYSPALADVLQRQGGAEQYGLKAQAQMFSQGLGEEELARIAQQQAFAQRLGRETLGKEAQQQAFAQRMGMEGLDMQAQQQTFGQRKSMQDMAAAAQAQRFNQAGTIGSLTGQEFQANLAAATQAQNMATQAVQAKQGFSANAAQIASGILGTQQGALSPILSAYYNTPPNLGTVGTAMGGATNAFQLGGLNIVNPLDPTATSINMYPSQANLQERLGEMQINAAKNTAAAQLNAAQASVPKRKKFLGIF
jgi:hypothetical protein